MMQVAMRVSNRQLEASGVTVVHTVLMREATKLAEKRRQEATKRSGPKF